MYHIKADKRSIASIELIYQGLVKLLRIKPLELISISELTEVSGVGRTTFYRSFDGLDDVLRMKCDQTLTAFFTHLLDFSNTNPLIGNVPFIRPFLEFWVEDATLIEVLIMAHRMDLFKETFLRMAKGSQIRFPAFPDPQLDPFMQAIKFELSLTILTQWVQQGKSIPPQRLMEALQATFKSSASASIWD